MSYRSGKLELLLASPEPTAAPIGLIVIQEIGDGISCSWLLSGDPTELVKKWVTGWGRGVCTILTGCLSITVSGAIAST